MSTKLVSITLLTAAVFLLSACKSTAEPKPKPKVKPVVKLKAPVSKRPKVEVIYDVKLLPGKVQFSVVSNGCTKAKSFVLDTRQTGKNTTSVTLLRLHPDHCRAMPRLIQITKPLPSSITAKKKIRLPIRFLLIYLAEVKPELRSDASAVYGLG